MLRSRCFLLYTTALAIALLSTGCTLAPVAVDTALGLMPTAQAQVATPAATREPLPMEETVWVLQSLNGVPPFADVEITMEFRRNFADRGDMLGGRGVCNGYGVPYQLDGQRLLVTRNALESSAEGCLPESYNDLEQQYYDVLSRVENYELEGDRLTLSTADGDTLVFAPQAQTGTITFVSMPFGSPSVLTPPRTTVLTGKLTVQDNCLFVQSYCPVENPSNPQCRYVPIWPGGYLLDTETEPIQILDDSDRTVARVGERIAIRGAVGSLDLAQSVRQNLESQLPSQCGSFEIVSVLELGGTVTEYTFDTATIQLPRQSESDVIKARNYAGVGPQVLTGTLTLSDGCLLVEDGDPIQRATPLWPPDVELVQNAGVIEVVDATGNVLARVGEEVNLLGGRADSSSVSLLRRIHVDCRTPFWTVLP